MGYLTSSDLMKLQLAWLDQDLDEYEAQTRLETFLEAGLDPDLAAAAVSAEVFLNELVSLRERVEMLEQAVTLLAEKLEVSGAE
jgi:hypothetical protein